MVYDSFDNALFEKDEKFKTTWLKNLDHNIEKYNLYGFTSGVQVPWIYEAIGGLPSTWVVKTKKKIPRIVQWKPMASSKINFAEVYSFFNDESRLGDVLQTLEPISKENFKETVVGFIDTFSKRPNKDSPTGRSYMAPDDYGVYTDVGNQNFSTPTSLYSFFGDVSGESVQVFTEVPPGVSKFGRVYIPSYVYNSLYMIPPLRRGKNARPIPRPQIMDHEIDMNTSVDINPLRGLEDSSLFAEFDRWFTGDMTVDRRLLILVNLDGEHWVLARVDFRKNKVWIYDSLLTFHDDKRYKLKFKPLEVIFPRWLEYVGFYNIHLSCGVPTLGKLSQLRARHNKSPELAIAVFLY
ncbi:hypothetical protein CUMW_239760 [Citrus unshiu]|uniref:Ubiquitin-like protease family profile domain-containing protein n=1 Tax=Citrus unshiu TaxID=55188 RepID=A0A2H5QLY5_CITUN|nr:hypothetical protein CUMW_239760 [Citrus unshiu]